MHWSRGESAAVECLNHSEVAVAPSNKVIDSKKADRSKVGFFRL